MHSKEVIFLRTGIRLLAAAIFKDNLHLSERSKWENLLYKKGKIVKGEKSWKEMLAKEAEHQRNESDLLLSFYYQFR